MSDNEVAKKLSFYRFAFFVYHPVVNIICCNIIYPKTYKSFTMIRYKL